MSRSPTEYIRHMLDEIEYIEFAETGTDRRRFLQDETLKRSVVRSIEIIGEAAKKIPADFRLQHSEVPWPKNSGNARQLIHDYFGVDYGLVWDVVEHSLPALRKQLSEIIKQ